MLGSGSVTISGTTSVANMLVMIQQSTDGGNTWTDFAPVLTTNSSTYQTAAPAPPAFGTVWYRANFTGIVPTPSIVAGIQNGTITLNEMEYQQLTSNSANWLNGRVLWIPPPKHEPPNPVTVSSASTDATVVAVPIVIIIAIVGVALWMRSRKKKSTTAK